MSKTFPPNAIEHYAVEVRPDVPDGVVLTLRLLRHNVSSNGLVLVGRENLHILLKPEQALGMGKALTGVGRSMIVESDSAEADGEEREATHETDGT